VRRHWWQLPKQNAETMVSQVEHYYHFVRAEIAPLLPKYPMRILEIGAASGATLRWLKKLYPEAETTGIELNPALLPELRQNADIAIISAVEDCMHQLSSYDLILALDVLEHLPDSLGTLQKLCGLLERPLGQVIVSLPNVAHLSISMPLLFKRRFEYQDAGILDRTHLRFFTEASAVNLLNQAGLIVTRGIVTGLQGPKSRLLNRLSFGSLQHYLARQYIMCGCPAAELVVNQARIRWGVAA
jgi:2-polyprenyl-3-methyl-5-hydroxy-6-metoxy-1,4-benzoquinol methylase